MRRSIHILLQAVGWILDMVGIFGIPDDLTTAWSLAESARPYAESPVGRTILLALGTLLLVIVYGRWLAKRWSRQRYDVQLRFEETDYYERTIGSVRRFRVGIINNTENRLEDVSIRLDDCKDETGIRPEIDMPFGLKREEGLGPAPLSPHSPKHAIVVQLDESDPDASIVIPRISSLVDTPSGYELFQEHLDRRKSYLLTVGAHPTTSAPHQMTFRVWVDTNGRLRMEEHMQPPITYRRWRSFRSRWQRGTAT